MSSKSLRPIVWLICAGLSTAAAGAQFSHAKVAPLSKRCGLISEMFSPKGLAPLRDYIRDACLKPCTDKRIFVDVLVLPKEANLRKPPDSLFGPGEVCEGDSFSVLTADHHPTVDPPSSVLQVDLFPNGENRYTVNVHIASYSPAEGASGMMLCGEFNGTAEYRRSKWRIKEAPL